MFARARALTLLLACAGAHESRENAARHVNATRSSVGELSSSAQVEVGDYTSLQLAIADQADIVVTKNIVFPAQISIPAGWTVTISGATGIEKLDGGNATRHFYNEGTLLLKSLTLEDGNQRGSMVAEAATRRAVYSARLVDSATAAMRQLSLQQERKARQEVE